MNASGGNNESGNLSQLICDSPVPHAVRQSYCKEVVFLLLLFFQLAVILKYEIQQN